MVHRWCRRNSILSKMMRQALAKMCLKLKSLPSSNGPILRHTCLLVTLGRQVRPSTGSRSSNTNWKVKKYEPIRCRRMLLLQLPSLLIMYPLLIYDVPSLSLILKVQLCWWKEWQTLSVLSKWISRLRLCLCLHLVRCWLSRTSPWIVCSLFASLLRASFLFRLVVVWFRITLLELLVSKGSGPIRVGFVSSFLKSHSVGRLMNGVISHLSSVNVSGNLASPLLRYYSLLQSSYIHNACIQRTHACDFIVLHCT